MTGLDDILTTSATQWPGRPALAWEGERLTYAELNRKVDRIAACLSSRVSPGQRVGVLAPNAPALVAALFAVWRRGAVPVTLNVRWREFELRQILADAQIVELLAVESHGGYSFVKLLATLAESLPTLGRCVFLDPCGEIRQEVAAGPARETEPLDPGIGVLHYTSGTTGRPKGVMVPDAAPRRAAAALGEVLESNEEDVCLLVIPASHAFGFLTLVTALAAGNLLVLVDSTFSPAGLLEALHRHRPTLLHGAPSLFTSLARSSAEGFPSLRTGLVGGTACAPQLIADLDRLGFRVLNSYGMTEIGAATSCRLDDPAEVRHSSVGRPLPGYEFRIAGGEEGEVQVRGPCVTSGYFRQPALSQAALADGWFRTGDFGWIDRLGCVHLSGRGSDVIHVAGLKVFPAEVEACLLTHPDIVEAVLVGLPHETMGETPAAWLVPRHGSKVQARDVLQFMRRRIAGYKLPYLIRFAPDLPRLASGKPDRLALARRLQEEQYAGHYAG